MTSRLHHIRNKTQQAIDLLKGRKESHQSVQAAIKMANAVGVLQPLEQICPEQLEKAIEECLKIAETPLHPNYKNAMVVIGAAQVLLQLIEDKDE